MTHEIQWEEAQRICDLPSVDEMIHTLVHDATNDNAVCLVREILKQGCATSKEASDHTEDALDMVSPVNQSLTTDPCGACGGDGVLAGSECGFCDGKNADRTVKESLQVAAPAQPCRDDVRFAAVKECHRLHKEEGKDYHTFSFVAGWEAALRTQPAQQAATAEPSVPVQAVTLTEDIAALMKFYGVGTMQALALEQDKHITRLQEKLQGFAILTQHIGPTRVREG